MSGCLKKHFNSTSFSQLDNLFAPIDLLFAKTIMQNPAHNVKIALSYIFALTRKGHLNLNLAPHFCPNPELIFKDFSANSEELQTTIKNGLEQLPKHLLEKITSLEAIATAPLIMFEEKIYLKRSFLTLQKIYLSLKKLSQNKPQEISEKALFAQKLTQCISDKKLLPEQAAIAQKALDNTLTFVFGGPGTGKSYTAAIIAELLATELIVTDSSKKIIATAPTGKAALRLQQALQSRNFAPPSSIKGTTLHALLGMREEDGLPSVDTIEDAFLIIVDEAAMIERELFAYFLERLPQGVRVLFLGDPDQLPPITGGSVFNLPFLVNVCTLTHPFRFEEKALYDFMQAVKEQNTSKVLSYREHTNPKIVPIAGEHEMLFFLENEAQKVFLSRDKEPHIFLKNLEKLAILSPFREGPFGVDNINRHIMHKLFSKASFFPIMLNRNRAKLNIYNGMLGAISKDSRNCTLPDGTELSLALVGGFDYAYALSVHKSQGCEFDKVILILPQGSEIFGKELLYTAATRAKKELLIFSSDETLIKMLQNSSAKL